jgi:hypothetical protein
MKSLANMTPPAEIHAKKQPLPTYPPTSFRPTDITNNIIVNVLRIIAGFPTINDYTMNSDRSVAIAAGLSLNPTKSRFYDSFDKLRFEHLQALRNDASCRARNLNIIEGKSERACSVVRISN